MLLVGFILRHKLIFTGLLVVLGLALYYFFFTMPNAQAVAYMAKMQPGIASTKELFEQVSKTTSLSIFADPDIPLSEKQQQLDTVADINQKTLVTLEHLAGDGSQLSSPIIFPSSEYQQASDLRAKLLPLIGQSQEVIRDYTLLIEFMAYNYDTQVMLEALLTSGGSLSASSQQELLQESQKLAGFQVPAEFKDLQAKIVENLNMIASNDLAFEVIQANNKALGYELFSIVAKPSQTVKNATDLPEKLQSNNL